MDYEMDFNFQYSFSLHEREMRNLLNMSHPKLDDLDIYYFAFDKIQHALRTYKNKSST